MCESPELTSSKQETPLIPFLSPEYGLSCCKENALETTERTTVQDTLVEGYPLLTDCIKQKTADQYKFV